MAVTGPSIATLAVFVLSIIFVIRPVSVSVRRGQKHIQVPLDLTTSPIIAIAILWGGQCLGLSQIRDGIVGTDGVKPYNILILFFSLAYMAITLDITGILEAAAFWVRNQGGSNGYKLFFYFYLMLTALSVLLGNDPVILSGTAFLVYYTQVTKLEPISWLISEFAAANTASMVLFVGNPTNVVICEGFSVNNAAFTAYTILPFLGCSLACLVALAFQFRHPNYIPRMLPATEPLNVRAALLDPAAAWVGSFLLGTCLLVIILVSFFHVDVWKISLPFAMAKFIFDVGWDYYRQVKGIPIALLKRQASTQPHAPAAAPKDSAFLEDCEPAPLSTGVTLDPPASVTTPYEPRSNVRSSSQDSASTSRPLILNQLPSTSQLRSRYNLRRLRLKECFPTFFTALPRLPFALIPFAFSQFILIEALAHQGWIDIFARWLVLASHREKYSVIWIIGVLGVILCNVSGTNIGATILLTKVSRAAGLPPSSDRAAAIALAVASNIGAVSFAFSASLAGLLWKGILEQKGLHVAQSTFARWNLLPILVMTSVGLTIVCAEMKVLYS